MGHVTLTTPISRVICHPRAGVVHIGLLYNARGVEEGYMFCYIVLYGGRKVIESLLYNTFLLLTRQHFIVISDRRKGWAFNVVE